MATNAGRSLNHKAGSKSPSPALNSYKNLSNSFCRKKARGWWSSSPLARHFTSSLGSYVAMRNEVDEKATKNHHTGKPSKRIRHTYPDISFSSGGMIGTSERR